MSHLGLKFDISQPKLVRLFAEEVSTPERLEMLLLETCADLAAVGPGVLNNWKIEVLTDFYFATSRRLAATGGAVVDNELDAKRRAAWLALSPSEQADPWFERQLAALPEAYVQRWSTEVAVETLQRLRRLPLRGGAAWANYLPETDTVEFIAGIDQGVGRAIFSSMAGVLTSNKMQILAAETNTLADDLLLLRYLGHVPEEPGRPATERLSKICGELVASIDSDQLPTFPKILAREQKEAAAVLANLPNDVRINNDLSDECTVVEVFTIDRRGLLYRLARALHDLRLVIRFAKIGTYLDQVVDVFYVTERDGTKPACDQRLTEIREALTDVIGTT
jgi:[protein-PII] uridylyltransferase